MSSFGTFGYIEVCNFVSSSKASDFIPLNNTSTECQCRVHYVDRKSRLFHFG